MADLEPREALTRWWAGWRRRRAAQVDRSGEYATQVDGSRTYSAQVGESWMRRA